MQKLLLALCLCVSAVNLSCSSNPADLRAMMPADSLVYLESNDFGAVMKAITDRPAFREAAKTVPDFSALNGVKIAVAVTGFETKEEPVTEVNSNLKFIPHFVTAIETNAWSFQANSFTENQLGEFVNHVYGGDVAMESYDKKDGRFYEWKTSDGRKAFALVQRSVIFFSNDDSSINKCLAVKRGEADSIAKNPKITDGERLAFGYVSPDGVAQISNIAGIAIALKTSEEEEVKSFVARVLPEIIRNSVSDVSWTATKSEQGIDDKFLLSMPAEVANVLNETMAPNNSHETSLADLLPTDPASVTLYNFKDPQIAWRSFLLLLQRQTDPMAGKLLAAFSDSLFEPYGVGDPELFLKSVGPAILTMKQDEAGEKLLVVAPIKDDPIKDSPEVEKSLPADTKHLSEVSKDTNYAGDSFMYMGRDVYIGDIDVIRSCRNRGIYWSARETQIKQQLADTQAAVVTIGTERTSATHITSVLGVGKGDDTSVQLQFRTETRFAKNGIERKTISDFGFIGWIITQFANEDD